MGEAQRNNNNKIYNEIKIARRKKKKKKTYHDKFRNKLKSNFKYFNSN